MKKTFTFAVALVAAMLNGQTQAGTITNGDLSVLIRTNGAIDTLIFAGRDFYNPGSPVSEFGIQLGTDASTFRQNKTNGSTGIATVSSSSIGGVETWTGRSGDLQITKQYSLVSGLDVLRVSTTLRNLGATALNGVRSFDTADPDQGTTSQTYNDRYLASAGLALEAIGSGNSLTTVWGVVPDVGGFSGGFGLGVTNGNQLNTLFSSGGADPNGALADIGLALAAEFDIAAGESASYDYFQAYGRGSSVARAEFDAAYATTPGTVPEPTSIAIFGIGAFGFVAGRLRRRRSEQSAC